MLQSSQKCNVALKCEYWTNTGGKFTDWWQQNVTCFCWTSNLPGGTVQVRSKGHSQAFQCFPWIFFPGMVVHEKNGHVTRDDPLVVVGFSHTTQQAVYHLLICVRICVEDLNKVNAARRGWLNIVSRCAWLHLSPFWEEIIIIISLRSFWPFSCCSNSNLQWRTLSPPAGTQSKSDNTEDMSTRPPVTAVPRFNHSSLSVARRSFCNDSLYFRFRIFVAWSVLDLLIRGSHNHVCHWQGARKNSVNESKICRGQLTRRLTLTTTQNLSPQTEL